MDIIDKLRCINKGCPVSQEAAEDIRRLRAQLAAAEAHIRTLHILLARYRDETPIGHQPHMIAHQADAALSRAASCKEPINVEPTCRQQPAQEE